MAEAVGRYIHHTELLRGKLGKFSPFCDLVSADVDFLQVGGVDLA